MKNVTIPDSGIHRSVLKLDADYDVASKGGGGGGGGWGGASDTFFLLLQKDGSLFIHIHGKGVSYITDLSDNHIRMEKNPDPKGGV